MAEDAFKNRDQYMKRKKLTKNVGENGENGFKKWQNDKLLIALSVFFKGHCLWPIDKCRYLGLFFNREL